MTFVLSEEPTSSTINIINNTCGKGAKEGVSGVSREHPRTHLVVPI